MSTKQLADLILAGWGFVALFSWAWMLFMAAFVPLWMLLLLRRLGSIGKELRRLNGMPVPDGAGLFPNATVRKAEPAPASLGHQLLR